MAQASPGCWHPRPSRRPHLPRSPQALAAQPLRPPHAGRAQAVAPAQWPAARRRRQWPPAGARRPPALLHDPPGPPGPAPGQSPGQGTGSLSGFYGLETIVLNICHRYAWGGLREQMRMTLCFNNVFQQRNVTLHHAGVTTQGGTCWRVLNTAAVRTDSHTRDRHHKGLCQIGGNLEGGKHSRDERGGLPLIALPPSRGPLADRADVLAHARERAAAQLLPQLRRLHVCATNRRSQFVSPLLMPC